MLYSCKVLVTATTKSTAEDFLKNKQNIYLWSKCNLRANIIHKEKGWLLLLNHSNIPNLRNFNINFSIKTASILDYYDDYDEILNLSMY